MAGRNALVIALPPKDGTKTAKTWNQDRELLNIIKIGNQEPEL